jgi:GNAT superfamily N-acetyltransferase
MAGRQRPMSGIAVVPFRRELAGDFRRLNLDWIERLFAVEEPDRKVLDDPEGAIIAKGGMIFFALDGEVVVGTAAMIRISDARYQLAKMAVADTHQRRGIGELLGQACKDWAVGKGVRTVFLETNSRLGNAIRLYERLGFRHAVDPHPSDYARADVYMELPTGQSQG